MIDSTSLTLMVFYYLLEKKMKVAKQSWEIQWVDL